LTFLVSVLENPWKNILSFDWHWSLVGKGGIVLVAVALAVGAGLGVMAVIGRSRLGLLDPDLVELVDLDLTRLLSGLLKGY
jgi:hypothetical protein